MVVRAPHRPPQRDRHPRGAKASLLEKRFCFTFQNGLILLFLQDQRLLFFFKRGSRCKKGQGDYLVGKIVFAGTLLVPSQKSDLFMT